MCIGLFFLLFSGFCQYSISALPDAHATVSYGTGFFPEIIVVCMAIISLKMIIAEFISKSSTFTVEINKEDTKRVVIGIAISVAYVVLQGIIGYLITSILTLAAVMWLFGARKKITIILVATIVPLILYCFFEMALGVVLPTGVL